MTWKLLSKKAIKNLIFISACSLSASCSLPEDEVDLTLAPVSYTKVDEALWSELKSINADSYWIGQYAYYEHNYRGDLSPIYLLEDRIRQLNDINISDNGNELKMALRELHRTYDQYNNVEDEKTFDVIWRIPLIDQGSAPLTISAFGKSVIAKTLTDEEPPKDDYTFEYYNLETRKVKVAVPAATKSRPDCGGFTNCAINGTEVRFVLKIKNHGELVTTYEVKQVISKEIPPIYLFDENRILPIAYECYTYLFDKNLISECTVLRDVQK